MPEALGTMSECKVVGDINAPPRGQLPFKPAHIYVLRDPRDGGVRYVGVTTQAPQKRFGSHLTDAKSRPTTPVRRWIRHIGGLGLMPIMDVIEIVPAGDGWCAAERRWIAYYRGAGVRLKNLTDGGDGTHGLSFTAAHRAAISKANKGSKRTLEQRARMGVAAKKRGVHPITREMQKLSVRRETRKPETGERQRAARLGKKDGPRTEEAKAKMRAARLLNPTGNAGKVGAANAFARAVLIDGVRYATVTDAARQLGLSQPTISMRLKVGTATYATDTGCPAFDAEAARLNAEAAARFAGRTGYRVRAVIVDGVQFRSLKEAAKHHGICSASMIGRIKTGRASYAD